MIGFSELAILMAVVGFILFVASIFYDAKAAQLKSVGLTLLVIGIVLWFVLYLFG